jgi:hypothetical protein
MLTSLDNWVPVVLVAMECHNTLTDQAGIQAVDSGVSWLMLSALIDAQGQRHMVTDRNPVIILTNLQRTPLGEVGRSESIVDMVGLLWVALQEKCWPRLLPLLLIKYPMILALESQFGQFSDNIRMVPPTVRLRFSCLSQY